MQSLEVADALTTYWFTKHLELLPYELEFIFQEFSIVYCVFDGMTVASLYTVKSSWAQLANCILT